VYIGYTQCPDMPDDDGELEEREERAGAASGPVSFVMITADPDHDTPAVMKEFVRAFDPGFIGLSGSKAELEPVWTAFGAQIRRDVLPESATGYSVSHPSSLFVLAKDGRLALKIPYGRTVPEIAGDLRGMLQ
jgi:protein SCO1/2